jgi:polysaccharide pyruvyl transferase WcaK-like protein
MVPRADLVVLRDEESASVLTDAGVEPPFRIGSDPTWVLFDPPHDDSRRPRDGRTITVALSHLAADREATDTLTEVLRPMVDEWSIRLQPWQHGANDLDRRLADELRLRLGRVEIIDPPEDLHAAAATFADDDLVIGMRFHALVAAAAAGSRFVAISHEPKLAGLARRMSQAAVPGHATAEVMRGTIEWALANEPPSAAAVRNEIANASHAFDLLELLLDGDSFARPDELAALPLSSGTGTW